MLKGCFMALILLSFAGTAAAHDEPVIGSLAGSTYAHETDHHHHGRGNGGYARHHNHVHFAPVGYRGNGNGAAVYCEPGNG